MSPTGNGKKYSVRKHIISRLCTTAEAQAKNVDKGEHFEAFWRFAFTALFVDVQTAEYKNHNKKSDPHDTLAKKYSFSAVEIEKKI